MTKLTKLTKRKKLTKSTKIDKIDKNWGNVQVNQQQLINFQDRGATCSRSKKFPNKFTKKLILVQKSGGFKIAKKNQGQKLGIVILHPVI